MKNVKKIFAMALALIMVLGLATTASAAETELYDVEITNAAGHDYQIYQIFVGDLSKNAEGKEILSNVKYGEDMDNAGKPVPQTVLNAVAASDFTDIVPSGEGKPMVTTGDVAKIEDLVPGYYMIVDVTDPLPDGNPSGESIDTLSAVIFQVVGDTEVVSKHTGTTIVKKVQDINDSTGEMPTDEAGSTWIDSADYDIKDIVPFKVTSTFTGLTNYTTYKVIFTDTMSEGLTYNNDMKVYLMGEDENGEETKTDVTTNFTIAASVGTANDAGYENGTVITAECADIIEFVGEDVLDATFVLEYTATLNDKAKLGAPGNPNKIKVKFMPDGEGENETPEDVNIVFTYKYEANKYANEVKEGNELTGAGFTLYKWYVNAELPEGGEWKAIGEEVKGEAMFKFEWKGIDDGKYKLEETTTPAGFNTIAPMEFEVVAGHVLVADAPTLETLTGGEVHKGEVASGVIASNVINESGTILPETGGIGTKIFTFGGSALVAIAVILLVTKKRMTASK